MKEDGVQLWPTVNLIAAVGKNGQIGVDSGLPWPRDEEDMKWFYQTTRGGSLIMGARTARALGWEDMRILSGGRMVFLYHGTEPDMLIDKCQHYKPESDVWICGGAYTYKRFMPYVRRSFITHINYEASADTLMPPLWGIGSC